MLYLGPNKLLGPRLYESIYAYECILCVNEKLPALKFQYFGKYIIQLFGYCYVHVSGQRRTVLERLNSSTSPGTMVLVMHVHFMFFAVLKNLKSSFSEDNVPEHALDIFIKNATKIVWVIPLNAKKEIKLYGSTTTLFFPIQCNGNYRGPPRNEYNA